MATKQKQKIIALDFPIITTILGEALDRWQYEIKQKDTKCALGFKEERTVHIMAEESVYLKNKKIKLLSIDRLLEGEPPVSSTHTHTLQRKAKNRVPGIPPSSQACNYYSTCS